jgi:pimeloyl-ACP methyl ester carboxylesterase
VRRRATLTAAIASTFVAQGFAATMDRTVRRDDGTLIHWSLDRQQPRPKQGIFVLAQGSGCLAATKNRNLERAKRLLPQFAVVTVEKRGVVPGQTPADPFGGCSPDFHAHHTVSEWVADDQRVLGEAEKSPWWDGRLVLFGGSEGGAAVSMLAARVKPTALVVFSTAPGRSFRQTLALSVPPEVAGQIESELAKIKAEPTSSKLWGGNSYRWWADILDHDLTADLLSVSAPILIVQGARDRSAPVQVARMVRDDFQRVGRCNLTYWEYPDYDHQMVDVTGTSHLDDVLQRISSWLAAKLDPGSSETCPPPGKSGHQ